MCDCLANGRMADDGKVGPGTAARIDVCQTNLRARGAGLILIKADARCLS
jgi:hypothetical protein